MELGCFIKLDCKLVEGFVEAVDLTCRQELVAVATVDFIESNGEFEAQMQ